MACSKIRDFFVHILSCGEEPEQRPLVIGHPTNFRREDISIEGLTAEQQEFVREKARVDALRLHAATIPVRPARTDLGESAFDASESQVQRRSLKDRFSHFRTPSKSQASFDPDRTLASTTHYQPGENSFDFRHGKQGVNGSRDSITLHGSDIDQEKMI